MAKYQVGQKLWIVPVFGRAENGYEVTVKAVGRKWITLDNGMRFEASSSLPALEEGTNWRVYESKEHVDRYRRLRNNWSNLVVHLRNHPMPADMTTEKIIAAAELLGIDYEIVKGKEATNGN